MNSSTFNWPFFYHYPPYFTCQPVKETADKQSSLWGSLVLSYCKHHKVYILSPSEDNPLWHNKNINRRLPPEAAVAFLDDLVTAGHALWLDPATKTRCLILWRRLPDVAAAISAWAGSYGVSDSVMLLDELTQGPEVAGTELDGLHREVLVRALHLLEQQGKVKLFRGATPEEEGVKFL
eukprot:GHRR01003609.1.p1 GENE.GHRR01003609.1~~GHRR01003609.1.p1  ORF type:complete len:179 (+),score=55.73 GHRR01003609.1:488-1024(+)